VILNAIFIILLLAVGFASGLAMAKGVNDVKEIERDD
jgi:hypothetical protein